LTWQSGIVGSTAGLQIRAQLRVMGGRAVVGRAVAFETMIARAKLVIH